MIITEQRITVYELSQESFIECNYEELLAELSDEPYGLSDGSDDDDIFQVTGVGTDSDDDDSSQIEKVRTDSEEDDLSDEFPTSTTKPYKEDGLNNEFSNFTTTLNQAVYVDEHVTPRKSVDVIAHSYMESIGEEKEIPAVPYVGQMFDTLDQAKIFYNRYAQENGFDVRSRSTQKRIKHDSRVSSCLLVCAREGLHIKIVSKRIDNPQKHVTTRNCSTQKCGCKAMLRLCLIKDGRWRVTRFHEEHNHKPVTPSKRMCMKGNKHMPKAAKDLVDAFREENLPVSKVAAILNGKVVGFNERDCYNHLGASKKHKTPIYGDAAAMLNFFKKKQIEDPHFFYAVQPDSDSRAVNFFWVDGRSRMQYEFFGDVLYFDTTYKKNLYKMPYAPFTGVNHHLQSVQFGCALLLDETEETFVWVFETFLGAMGGKPPISMITDQDAAMYILL